VSVGLNILGRHDKAAEYLARCVDGQPHNDTAFRNLLMALYAADRYSDLHERATRGLSAGPSRAQEIVCREFLALSAAELGNYDEATAHLAALAAIDEAAAVRPTAAVWERVGRSPDEIRAMLRESSDRHPTDPMIATHLVVALLPASAESAVEIRRLLEGRVAPFRQLSPRELGWLGRAYAETDDFEQAERTFRHAVERFPDDQHLRFDLAVTLSDLGRVDEAYEVMKEAAQTQPPSAAIQQNMALLARATGRLDQAIELFEQACQRAPNRTTRRALAGQLFELRRLRGDPGKELLRAAMQLGDRSDGEDLPPELEARFLVMSLLAGTAALDSNDQDVQRWAPQVQTRLSAFCDKYPKHDALRRFRIPEGVDPQALETLIVSEIYARAYPSLLLGQQLEIAARGVPYPLCVRARRLTARAGTTVSYWQVCIGSGDRAHRVHCVVDDDLEPEIAEVPLGDRIVIDVTALLTLKHLGLLDEALACFAGWTVAAETRHVIDAEALGYPAPSPLAREMGEWLLARRGSVAVRRLARHASDGPFDDRFTIAPSGLWVPQQVPETILLPDGVGASMRLAAQLRVPLYSDEGFVRQWARTSLGVRAFGTVAFLGSLRRRGNLTLSKEATLISILLAANYRNVPYGAIHLHAAIRDVVERSDAPPNSAALNQDPVAGVLLRHVGDPEMSDLSVARASGALLALCISDEKVPTETTDDLAYSLSFKNQLRVPGGVLAGSPQQSPAVAVAQLWAYVLVGLSQAVPALTRAWSLMRRTAEMLYRADATTAAQVPSLVATIFVRALRGSTIDLDGGDQILLRIATAMPENDQRLWFAAIQERGSRPDRAGTG
jgi:tetratricopeptide (TPR) repeat protein